MRIGAGQDVSESDGAGIPHAADRGRSRTCGSKPDRDLTGAGAGRGESESDRAGAYQAHARRTWIGAGPAMARTGAGQDVSESDGARALHTADRGRNRTHDRAVGLGSGGAGAGPATIPVLVRRAGTAARQEATSKDEGLSPGGPARWARTRMDS